MTLYNIMFLYRFFHFQQKFKHFTRISPHITVLFIFFFYTAFSFFLSFPPLPLSSCFLSCFMICTFKKHLSMNSTQHHTICLIIVSEFNQIFFEIVYYPSLSPLFFFLFLISRGYIFYDDTGAMLVLSD